MPEFPEVHHQVAWLRGRVTGWVVDDYGFTGGHFPELKGNPARQSILDGFFKGASIGSVTQRGKHIVMALPTGTVTSHLMHSGRWTLADEPYVSSYRHHKELPAKKASTFWLQSQGRRLEFNEPEYRGKVHAFPGQSSAQLDELTKLGPDVLLTPESDPSFAKAWTVDDLKRSLAGARKSVKEILLDQEQQAGIGNTYAVEALYRAGVAPRTVGNAVPAAKVAELHAAVVAIVGELIANGLDYTNVVKVYRKERDPAGNPVEVVKIGGRDTYWVPAVQR